MLKKKNFINTEIYKRQKKMCPDLQKYVMGRYLHTEIYCSVLTSIWPP